MRGDMQGGISLRYVDHTYRDFSRYIEEGGKLIKHKKCKNNFPAKVHQMLSNPNNAHVITWMPHGRSWKVLDKELLISTVVPQYNLVCKKYDSFTRQLNGWGFKRMYQSGPDVGCYYHEVFLRGLPKLTCLVRRLPSGQGKATPYPAGEPNFYRISEMYPLPPLVASSGDVDSPAASPQAAPSRDAPQDEILHPSSPSNKHSSQESLVGLATAAAVAAAAIPSKREPPAQKSATDLITDHLKFAADVAADSAAPSNYRSHESQYPVGSAVTAAVPYNSSHGIDYNARDSLYPQQPLGYMGYSDSVHPAHYPPPHYGYSVPHYGTSYYDGQYPAHNDQPPPYPRYDYPPPPQSLHPPQYHHHPPAHMAAPTNTRGYRESYNQSHGHISTNAEGHHVNNSYPDQSPRQVNRSPIIEPIPYSARPEREVNGGSDSPSPVINYMHHSARPEREVNDGSDSPSPIIEPIPYATRPDREGNSGSDSPVHREKDDEQ